VFWKPKDWKRFHCISSRSPVQTETLPGEILECSITSGLQELHEMVFSEQEEHKHSGLLKKSVQDEIDSFMHLEHVTWATWSMGFLLLFVGHFVRNNAFPTATGGKGADTSILSAWLEDEMGTMVACL